MINTLPLSKNITVSTLCFIINTGPKMQGYRNRISVTAKTKVTTRSEKVRADKKSFIYMDCEYSKRIIIRHITSKQEMYVNFLK